MYASIHRDEYVVGLVISETHFPFWCESSLTMAADRFVVAAVSFHIGKGQNFYLCCTSPLNSSTMRPGKTGHSVHYSPQAWLGSIISIVALFDTEKGALTSWPVDIWGVGCPRQVNCIAQFCLMYRERLCIPLSYMRRFVEHNDSDCDHNLPQRCATVSTSAKSIWIISYVAQKYLYCSERPGRYSQFAFTGQAFSKTTNWRSIKHLICCPVASLMWNCHLCMVISYHLEIYFDNILCYHCLAYPKYARSQQVQNF